MKLVPSRFIALLLAVCAVMVPQVALAKVSVAFHSFNGSVLFGRYPHAFVVFEGTLDDTGERVYSNYGYTAVTAGPAVLAGPVRQTMMSEKDKYIRSTNRHFTVTVSDATYRKMIAEVAAWRDKPGKNYVLDSNNCIHFVGAIMQLAGVRVTYPSSMVRKPKAWMNHITRLNPQLGARQIP